MLITVFKVTQPFIFNPNMKHMFQASFMNFFIGRKFVCSTKSKDLLTNDVEIDITKIPQNRIQNLHERHTAICKLCTLINIKKLYTLKKL